MQTKTVLSAALLSVAAVLTVSFLQEGSMARSLGMTGEDSLTHVSPTPKRESSNAVNERDGVVFISDWDGTKLERSEAEWKELLTDFEYYILREKGTENPYTGKLNNNKLRGIYHCAACGLALFSSKHKYDSQTGWPSFSRPISKTHIAESEDRSIPGEIRTEVVCARCGSHQGHVFDDGPEPTGLRYCINSAALKFARSK